MRKEGEHEDATQSMRAIQVHRYGGPEQLKLEELPRPEPSSGEVLLRVYAAGVNPIDWKIRQGLPHSGEGEH
jgi:NADPH:quinone reductase-like Zn-dependent oxidoreductase